MNSIIKGEQMNSIISYTPINPIKQRVDPCTTNETFIQKKVSAIFEEVLKGAKAMGINNETISKISLKYHLENYESNPYVLYNRKTEKIEINIPFLFLLEQKDFKEHKSLLDSFFSTYPIKPGKEEANVNAFFNFIAEDPALVEASKKFVLYHEIAHIFHQDIYTPAKNNNQSLKREFEADMKAAETCPESINGAIYLFNIMKQHLSEESITTHPSFAQRSEYLKKVSEYLQPKDPS